MMAQSDPTDKPDAALVILMAKRKNALDGLALARSTYQGARAIEQWEKLIANWDSLIAKHEARQT